MQSLNFLERLLAVTKQLAEIHDLHDALHYVVKVAVDFVQAQRGYLVLFETDDSLDFRVCFGVEEGHHPDPAEAVSTSIVTRVRDTGEAQLIVDALEHDEFRFAASVRDNRLRSVMCVPLTTQEQRIGALYVENRTDAHLFNKAHLRTLHLFAGHTAALIANMMLQDDLRQSREDLVVARETERQRLRRDLHDGIGPVLATLAMEIQTAGNLIEFDSETSREMLNRAHEKAQTTLDDLRRIVHNLRPPALDELGLVYALREIILNLRRTLPLHIVFTASDEQPQLNAAVEVAIYHIVREALLNVIRHADATTCRITLDFDDVICIDIMDDGVGIAHDAPSGVGLRSIRERTDELRGTFTIIPRKENLGTHLRVIIPRSHPPIKSIQAEDKRQ